MSEHFETNAIRNQNERSQFSEHSTPLYLTSSFVFEDAEDMRASFAEEKERNLYSRFTNPNTTEFVNKIIEMEGAEAGYAFATGMAAIFTSFAALLKAGEHIVSCSSVLVLHMLCLPNFSQNGILKLLILKLMRLIC